MGKTYQYDLVNVPNIFRDIVAQVSDNLSSESTLNIPQVSFKHGNWLDIQNELIADNADPTKKGIKYPLVCLITPFKYSENAKIVCDLLIVNSSTKNAKNDSRYTNNYEPVINPIYSELCQLIADSSYFLGYNQDFKHTYEDLLHIGNVTEQKGYVLPDVLDGKIMQGVELTLNEKACASEDSYIQYLRYDLIREVRVAGVSTPVVAVTLFDATSFDALDNSPTTYTMNNGQGVTTPILVGTPIVFNVSSVVDGWYEITITSSKGAMVIMPYRVVHGRYEEGFKVVSVINDSYFQASDRLVYDFTINATTLVTKIDSGNINVNGVLVDSFHLTSSLNITNVSSINMDNEDNTIDVFLSNGQNLANKIILNTSKI